MNERDFTKKMLHTIRESVQKSMKVKPLVNEDSSEKDNFLTRAEILMEEAEKSHNKKKLNEDIFDSKKENTNHDFVISANDPQFSNLRSSQEESLRKTVGDVELKDDAFVYHADIDDITLDGTIKGLNIKFQFRLNDPSSVGCYITAADLQLTESNLSTVQKIRSAFLNWKDSLTSDGNTLKDLEKAAQRKREDDGEQTESSEEG